MSQLLAYRRGEYDPSVALNALEDDQLKSMVLHMIQPAADMRLSAAECVPPLPWPPSTYVQALRSHAMG